MNNKKLAIIIVLVILLGTAYFSNNTFAKLQKEVKIDYKTVTGSMICEYEIDNNESYVEDGVRYFLINVKNYKILENNTKDITDVNIKYSLTIKNKNNSNGIYKWIKVGTNEKGEYSSTSKTDTFFFTTETEQTDTFKVYVQLDNQDIAQNVDIDIELNAEQVEKE